MTPLVRRARLALATLLVIVPALAGAQRVPRPKATQPKRPPVTAPGQQQHALPGDTSRARAGTDTTRDTTLVQWPEPDSVMRALMGRNDYTITRYLGDTVVFDASHAGLVIRAGEEKKVAVQRGDQVVVADSSIYYNDSTKIVYVRGQRIVLRDPGSGQADVVGTGSLEYNLRERSGRITNPTFAVNQNGQEWRIAASIGKPVLGDSAAGKQPAFYGRGGTLTSCTDSIPDYHFEFREVKKSSTNTLVARPAVLYIADIPVMWLPFIFQDTRSGRRSGILTPRFGLSDIVRNSPNYRREVDNIGYYFALSDYLDAQTWLDWRSSAGGTQNDPGWLKFNGQLGYNWLERHVQGSLASGYLRQRDGQTNLALTWTHRQEFSRYSSVNASVNYVTSTRLQRQTTFNPYAVIGTIASNVNFQQKIGAANLNFGASRTQHPGRDQVEQEYPKFNLTTGPLNLTPWLVWTPTASFSSRQQLHLDDNATLSTRFVPVGDSVVAMRLNRSRYTNTASFGTPIRIFGYDIGNQFRFTDDIANSPQKVGIIDVATGETRETRLFTQYRKTTIDWDPVVQLPPFMRSLFNITPSFGLQNAMGGPFWIRSPLTDNQWVHQSKRPTFSLAAAPSIYGFFPGFGPFTRIRHSLQPQISFSYAPGVTPDTNFLRAQNMSAKGYLGGLRQESINLGFSQNIEAKVRLPGDTSAEGSTKLTLLSMQFSGIGYDFERAHHTGRAISGLTTDRAGFSFTSDLLPGFNFRADYSLFQGSIQSDTATFSPYLEGLSAGMSWNQQQNPFVVLKRLFGRAMPVQGNDVPPGTTPAGEDQRYTQQLAAQPVAGQGSRGGAQFLPTPTQGFSASFQFSLGRQRPPRGGSGSNIADYDPTTACDPYKVPPYTSYEYNACIENARTQPVTGTVNDPIVQGATLYRIPPQIGLSGNINLQITPKWTGVWNTQYDFVRHEFASHTVSLVRDLHDWRAIFGFTKSPNGNFAFNFSIALKAEPDLKFDYNKATVRSSSGY